jgi:hypothetical protein
MGIEHTEAVIQKVKNLKINVWGNPEQVSKKGFAKL